MYDLGDSFLEIADGYLWRWFWSDPSGMVFIFPRRGTFEAHQWLGAGI